MNKICKQDDFFNPNPKQEISEAIASEDLLKLLRITGTLHGHFCPGSALGVMASVYGLNMLKRDGVTLDGMEELIAIVETNACFSDGVQMVSGCTLGNNGLIYRDLGKHAVTFAIRGKDTGVRVRVLPYFRTYLKQEVPEFFALIEQLTNNTVWTATKQKTYREKGWEAACALIKLPFEKVLSAKNVPVMLPDYAPLLKSVVCDVCGEEVMATKSVSEGTRSLCLTCSGERYFQVEGKGIVAQNTQSKV
ncbi:MAG: FmdE family protein [Candidatus Bathyarchaeota archaeon]|nr:FmdE family protein [Candidatus Bathyarchaeota archaeon]